MRPPAGFSIPFPSARPRGHPAPQPAPPWDVPRRGPRPQRFRVGGNANSRKTAGAHCAPLRKDGYPARRADNIRPYDKTGAQHSGRMISAPTKSGYPVWGTVHIRPRKTEIRYRGWNVSARRALFRSPVGAGPRPARRTRHPLSFSPPDPASPSLRPRRGGPCGRPPGSARGPLGRTPTRAAAPAFPCRRNRGQPRNRGRTLCAPTKGRVSDAGDGSSPPHKKPISGAAGG